jgi:signal transduction histidine kinase
VARLRKEIEVARAQIQALTKAQKVASEELIQSQDEERRRIARGLHDGTAQCIAALSMNLGVVKQRAAITDRRARRALAECLSLSEQASRELRRLSYLLHPPLLDGAGVGSALRRYAAGFAERSGIRVELALSPRLGRLPEDVETTLFRAVQECLANVHRHSGSRTAQILIKRHATDVVAEVKDAGRGTPLGALGRDGNMLGLGVGIRGMRERVGRLGGRLEINSGRRGTTVKAIVPLQGEARSLAARASPGSARREKCRGNLP